MKLLTYGGAFKKCACNAQGHECLGRSYTLWNGAIPELQTFFFLQGLKILIQFTEKNALQFFPSHNTKANVWKLACVLGWHKLKLSTVEFGSRVEKKIDNSEWCICMKTLNGIKNRSSSVSACVWNMIFFIYN